MVTGRVGETELGRNAAEECWEYIPPVEAHAIQSKYVAQVFNVEVFRPAQKREDATRFPVVYVTDGNFAFDALKGISHSMQLSEQDAPRFILVGIGYPGDSPETGARLRTRDLTFPRYPQLSTEALPVEGALVAAAGTKDFCGAEDFQRFIEHEVIPLVDAKYPTIPGERTYFGHSSGGGFGLFTLFTKAHLFNRYIASSPGLTYNGVTTAGVRYENYDFVFQLAREFIASGKPLPSIRMYMSVGAEEEFEPRYANWQLTSSFYRMAALLRSGAISGLEMTCEVIPGATHMTVWPISFIHGVQAVFGTRRRAGF